MSASASSVPPIVWTIAGADPCGGAGIQADLKTLASLGVHGCSVIAALTAQNSFAVSATESVSAAMLTAQIDALAADMPPCAIKTGMLGDPEGIRVLADRLAKLGVYTVCDPVMVASAGARLIAPESVRLMKELLFPQVSLLTPNVVEAEALTGRKIASDQDIEQAAADLLGLGIKAVVIKGWMGDAHFAQDYYSDGAQNFWLTSPARDGASARGTGCTFASVHAAMHARGLNLADAAVVAKAYINQALRLSQPIGRGAPILSHQPMPCTPQDFPWLTSTAQEGRLRLSFPDCGTQMLGFYPVVDSYAWLERLLPLGVTTAQLRIKDKTGTALEGEIHLAVNLARHHDCRLFVNDYWQLAIKHGAYGVHLGQEDLAVADMKAIADAGLRLGLSTHCYAEVARAVAFNPSYIAIGPIFETTLKKMAFAPQGIEALRQWRAALDRPLVAIGGITLAAAGALVAAGADSIAVVSDVTRNADPEARTREWLSFFSVCQNARNCDRQTEPQRRSASA